jgi:hypothetical protein
MKYCPQCGAPSDDSARFCGACGYSFESGQTDRNGNSPDGAAMDNSGTQSSYDQSGYDQSSYDQGGYNQSSYDQGSNNQSSYNQGGYNQSGYNGYQQDYNDGTKEEFRSQPYYDPNFGQMIGSRSIPLYIVLSIITCGLFSIYWMYTLNQEINQLSGENGTDGGMVILLSLITCGIYSLYWLYKMGERCDRIKGGTGDTSVLYLILGLIGFGIVCYGLMQDTINKAIGA